MAKQAVLLLAHGTPASIDQIPEYLRNVTGGRPLPAHLIQEVQRRYSLIGRSPLTEITFEQARLVEQQLAAAGSPVPVYVAMRNWEPLIPAVLGQICADGIQELAVICLAPQNSRTSVGLYRRAVQAGAASLRIDFTESWARHPLLARAFAERLQPLLDLTADQTASPVPVLFTAHSVPVSTIQVPAQPDRAAPADPYAEDARATADLVAGQVHGISQSLFAFQSQGASGGPWVGPTVEQTLDGLAAQAVTTLILQPIGFLCDHVEILYDVDILFTQYARDRGIRLQRPPSLNASPTLAMAIADLASQALERLRNS